MAKNILHSDFAPAAVGPYSQGATVGNLAFLSGQLGLDPATGKLAGDTIEAQTEQALRNVKMVLAQAHVGFDRVVKTTCFLADIADFAAFNAIYATAFPENPPARSCFQVAALPMGAKVEIEVIAELG